MTACTFLIPTDFLILRMISESDSFTSFAVETTSNPGVGAVGV